MSGGDNDAYMAMGDPEPEATLGPEARRHAASASSSGPPEFQGVVPEPRRERKFRARSWRLVAFLVLVAASAAAIGIAVAHSARHSHVRHRSFFVLTDVHFDVLYDDNCTSATHCRRVNGTCEAPPASRTGRALGTVGCDSPINLLHHAAAAMAKVDEAPDFLLVTGDFVAHRHEADFDKSIGAVAGVTSELAEAFPGTRILPAIGNNDAVTHWCGTTAQAWLGNLSANVWHDYLDRPQAETFNRGGYYEASIMPGLRVAVLNTVYYGQHYVEDCLGTASPEDDPHGQLKWFSEVLNRAAAAGERVIVAGHVPPVWNSLGVSNVEGAAQWYEPYTRKYLALVEQFAATVDVQFYAHMHRDGVRTFYHDVQDEENASEGGEASNAYGSLLLVPSVSPVYDNNPTFRRVLFRTRNEKYLGLHDYEQYFIDLEAAARGLASDEWRLEYRFRDAYMGEALRGDAVDREDRESLSRPLDTRAVAELVNRLFGDAALLGAYESRYAAQYQKRSDYTLCGLGNPIKADYEKCLGWR